MKLASMERTAKEKKAMAEMYDGPAKVTGPDFPYGLCLSLGKDELKKVGITELPEVGDEYTIVAIGKVTRVSQNASEQADTMSCDFQITDLALEEGSEPGEDDDGDEGTKGAKAIAEKLYPAKKK